MKVPSLSLPCYGHTVCSSKRQWELSSECWKINFFLQDVGQSILESYSRVMESLAFNIMARIDDVLYVDDATKRCAAAESLSLFSRGGLGGLPIQKRMSPSPFSIHHTPFASPFGTPTFCSSTPIMGSPGRAPSSLRRTSFKEATDPKSEKLVVPADYDKVWSYAGNLSSRRVSGDAPERDWVQVKLSF